MGTRLEAGKRVGYGKDHPHAYGDKFDFQFAKFVNQGSSPRVWGQVSPILYTTYYIRIIPTRMGTSVPHGLLMCECWDHPHAYGDKYYEVLCKTSAKGSSPRVWGQATQHHLRSIVCGIIPTRMGTSKVLVQQDFTAWDHPHAYGDKLVGRAMKAVLSGSSPRVWGQVVPKLCGKLCDGIIPTRMGTSPSVEGKNHKSQDHPHAYGDK